jgi:hypothetical protein
MVFWISVKLDAFFQTVVVRMIAGTASINHTIDMILDDGSKIENRLVIIFILFC